VSDSFDCIFEKIYYHHICFLSSEFPSFKKLFISVLLRLGYGNDIQTTATRYLTEIIFLFS